MTGIERGATISVDGLTFEVLDREDGLLFSVPDTYVSSLVSPAQWDHVKRLGFLPGQDSPQIAGVFESVRLDDAHPTAGGRNSVRISATESGATLTIIDGDSENDEGDYDFPLSVEQWEFLLSLGAAKS
jgi:hypothetical protein